MRNADPKVKQTICQLLVDFVYTPAKAKLDNQLVAIMNSHSNEFPGMSPAFMYKGTVYSSAGFRPVRGQKLGMLSRRLYDHMEKWVAEQKVLFEEEVEAHNYFACLVIEAKDTAELQALTPDFLHPALQISSDYSRPCLLTAEDIERFNKANAKHIQMLKERLVLNLIS